MLLLNYIMINGILKIDILLLNFIIINVILKINVLSLLL